MESQINKEERIEFRISSEDKKKFKRAQKINGDKTFSGFITRVLRNHSNKVITEKDKILASEKDRQIFFDAVFSNQEPNDALIAAAKRYQSIADKQ